MELIRVLLVMLCVGTPWANTVMDSQGGQCEILTQEFNMIIANLTEINASTVLKVSEDVNTTDLCYQQCCNLAKDGCNVANFAEHNGSLVCLSLHCEDDTCQWEDHEAAVMATLAPPADTAAPATNTQIIDNGGLVGIPEDLGTETEPISETETEATTETEIGTETSAQAIPTGTEDEIDNILAETLMPAESAVPVDVGELSSQTSQADTQGPAGLGGDTQDLIDSVLGAEQVDNEVPLTQEAQALPTSLGGVEPEGDSAPTADLGIEDSEAVPIIPALPEESASAPSQTAATGVTGNTEDATDAQLPPTSEMNPESPQTVIEEPALNPFDAMLPTEESVSESEDATEGMDTELNPTSESTLENPSTMSTETGDILPSTASAGDSLPTTDIDQTQTGGTDVVEDGESSWLGENIDWDDEKDGTLAQDDDWFDEDADSESEDTEDWDDDWNEDPFDDHTDDVNQPDNIGSESAAWPEWPEDIPQANEQGEDIDTDNTQPISLGGSNTIEGAQDVQWSDDDEDGGADEASGVSSIQAIVGGLIGATIVFLALMGLIVHQCRAKERAKYKPLREDFIPNYGDDMQYYDEEP